MLSVIRKEWRSYFATPIGYVFIAIFWLLGAAFFFLYNILAATANLSSLFGNLSYLFMLIVPLLTMRLFSEERKQKTDQLFYCAPVTLWSVVLGKFLAAVGVLGVSLAGDGAVSGDPVPVYDTGGGQPRGALPRLCAAGRMLHCGGPVHEHPHGQPDHCGGAGAGGKHAVAIRGDVLGQHRFAVSAVPARR